MRWVNWKEFLGPFFRTLSSFGISKHYVFQFDCAAPGVEGLKDLSRPQTLENVQLLKHEIFVDKIRRKSSETLPAEGDELALVPLSCVPSMQEGTRQGYLVKNVCERYYSGEAETHKTYLRDGSDWYKSS